LDALGFASDVLLRHDDRRLVYACELTPDARHRLWTGMDKENSGEEQALPDVATLAAAWRRRWLLARAQREEALAQLADLGPATVQSTLDADLNVQLPLFSR
jgi:hypothetical protein